MLRWTASRIDVTLQAFSGAGPAARPHDIGHAELLSAVDSFADASDFDWRQQVERMTAAADMLRDSAATYEDADDNAAGQVRTVEGFL